MKKLIAVVFTLALSAPVIAQQTAPKAAAPKSEKASAAAATDPVIMSWNGQEVHKSEFEAAVETLPEQYRAYASGPGRKAFAEDYLRMKMLASEAERAGLDKSPDVKAQLQLMRQNALANAQLNKMEKSIVVTDAEIQKAYEDHKNEYEQAKARHILIAFKGSAAQQAGKKELTEEEAKAKAEEIRKKLVEGADFAALAKAESDDPGSASRGGELGSFGRGQMVPEFEAAVFSTKAGELAPVVRTQYGYHVIRVEEKTSVPLETAKKDLEHQLKQEKLQKTVDEMKNNAKISFDDSYFATPNTASKSDNKQ